MRHLVRTLLSWLVRQPLGPKSFGPVSALPCLECLEQRQLLSGTPLPTSVQTDQPLTCLPASTHLESSTQSQSVLENPETNPSDLLAKEDTSAKQVPNLVNISGMDISLITTLSALSTTQVGGQTEAVEQAVQESSPGVSLEPPAQEQNPPEVLSEPLSSPEVQPPEIAVVLLEPEGLAAPAEPKVSESSGETTPPAQKQLEELESANSKLASPTSDTPESPVGLTENAGAGGSGATESGSDPRLTSGSVPPSAPAPDSLSESQLVRSEETSAIKQGGAARVTRDLVLLLSATPSDMPTTDAFMSLWASPKGGSEGHREVKMALPHEPRNTETDSPTETCHSSETLPAPLSWYRPIRRQLKKRNFERVVVPENHLFAHAEKVRGSEGTALKPLVLDPITTPKTLEPAGKDHAFIEFGGLLAQVLFLGGDRSSAVASANPANSAGQSTGEARLPIAELIQRSTEAFTELVRRCYSLFLGRSAHEGEEQGWVQLLLGGQTEEHFLSAFLSTEEFYQRAGTMPGSGTQDERFIQALYRLLLQRSATEVEVNNWLGALPGLERGGVAYQLVQTTEFRVLRVTSFYQELFGQVVSQEVAHQWACSPFDLLTIRVSLQTLSIADCGQPLHHLKD